MQKIKGLLLVAFFVLLHAGARAQNAWRPEYYQTVTVANFRSFAGFSKPIDTRNIDYRLLNACLYYTVNEQRKLGKLPLVPHHPALETTAFFHSKKMAEQKFFNHTNPKDPSRGLPDQRARLAGITNAYLAECIYVQDIAPGLTYLALCDNFTKGWMESPPHRDNIMSKNNKAFGAGIYYVANDYFGFRGTLNFQWFEDVVWDKKLAVDFMQ